MCGIFGFFGPATRVPSQRNATHALGTLSHRGPDAQGLYYNPERGLVLGHARLSIIDPEARSDQPFETAESVLLFNGEIYNYRQLRAELQAMGQKFRTMGDSEVIALGYARWGCEIFKRLRGMYAIALYDRKGDCLHLARDEFGIKPLCILERNGEIVFGSEVKAIAALRSLSIDGGVLADCLSWGFQMESASLYAGVRYLKPGKLLTIERSGGWRVQEQDIWTLREAYRAPGPELGSRALHDVMVSSVADHMIADVPVAVALSGGLDSSIVAAAAAEVKPDLQAFTFTLTEGRDPEVEHAALLCRHLGLRHTVARVLPHKIEGWLRHVAWHLEEPVANANALLSYGLSALLNDHRFKVVLVGEGADELFGGYPWYRLAQDPALNSAAVFDAYWQRRAQKGSVAFLRPCRPDGARNERLEMQRAAFEKVFIPGSLNSFLAYDQETQLQFSQLLRVDRMYMAHGVEARVPFLYRPVLQASASLPSDRMLAPRGMPGRQEKVALAEAFADRLPNAIRQRPKFGEQGTVNLWESWLSSSFPNELERCVSSAELRGARQLLEEFVDWRAVRASRLSAKEGFALALLIEAVDGVMLRRAQPESGGQVPWELLA
ncbi:asparagine synthase (glutamine-hydrolyzing) [Hylemonella sp. W303a]|uniref:asparagine synthase (glutamine-hydrolyzing) n=1 Tax=Hylemonella sp. W303a TaxID=3389873 RepID=UPI00396B157D